MSTNARYRLITAVLEKSLAKNWKEAVLEWEIEDVEEDESVSGICVCSHPNLRYLYTIQNALNGEELRPIGSCCIKKFGRTDLNEEIMIDEKLFALYHAVQNGKFISLDKQYFSRKLLKYFYERGAFQVDSYDFFLAMKDYRFLLNMFNKRNKEDITPLQKSKISAIILNSIKPFIINELKEKSSYFDEDEDEDIFS